MMGPPADAIPQTDPMTLVYFPRECSGVTSDMTICENPRVNKTAPSAERAAD